MQTLIAVNNVLFLISDAFWQASYYIVYVAPILLVLLLWQTYLLYIRAQFIKKEERVLLEIRIPKEITKSPRAMEMLLEIFDQGYEGELIDRFIKGSVRSWFSLELVSIGGKIHFYFQIPKFFQNLVESRIYSQYPEVEIAVVDDYTKAVNFGQPGSSFDIKGWEYKKDNKEQAMPIKTYIDYELEKDPKEEFKIDPMTPMLEFLSSIKPNEQVWIQIMIMAAKKRFTDKKGKKITWVKSGEGLINKLAKRDLSESDMSKVWTKANLTTGERDTINAIERNQGKVAFDVGMRALQVAPEIKPTVGVGLNSALKQYASVGGNGFKNTTMTGFANPWQDPTGWRSRRLKTKIFRSYCNRSYFYRPDEKIPFGLTTEELATIYHFPGLVATTPTLDRIPSKRGEPPENLPI